MINSNNRKLVNPGILALAFILCALIIPGWYIIVMVPVAILFMFITDRGGLFYLNNWKFWIWIGIGGMILPLTGGDNRVNILGIDYSLELLVVSLRVSSRGFLIFMGMTLIRRHISMEQMARGLWKFGLRRLSYLIPLAFHMVPVVMEALERTYIVWKLRGGKRRNLFKNIWLLLASFQVQLIKEAEQLSIALALHNMQSENH